MGTNPTRKKYESKDDSVLEKHSNLDQFTCDGLDSDDDSEVIEEIEEECSNKRKMKKSSSNENIKPKKTDNQWKDIPNKKQNANQNLIYEDINDAHAYFQDKIEGNQDNIIDINEPFPFAKPKDKNSNKKKQNKQESAFNSESILNQQRPESFFSNQINTQSQAQPQFQPKSQPQVIKKQVIKKETYSQVSKEDLHLIVQCMKKCEAKYQLGMKAVQDNNFELAIGIFTKTKDNIKKLCNIIKSKSYLPKDFSHSIITKLIEKSNLVNASLIKYTPYTLKQKITINKPIPINKVNTPMTPRTEAMPNIKPRNKSNPKPASIKKSLDDEAKQAFEDKIEGEILIKDPGIKFSDIVGMNDLKQILKEIVFLPLERPELFTGLRQPLRGLLLFGPPGTGKTMIAKAMAGECKSTFFNISASSLTSKWVGESEKTVRALFQLAYKKSPAIIFIDEIESILSKRSDNDNEAAKRLKTEFLIQFDGLSSSSEAKLLVVAATNRPLDLDDALLRRLPKKIYCGPLDMEGRANFIHTVMKSIDNNLSDTDLRVIAKQTNNYSNSDLKELCREASYEPVRELNTEEILSAKKLRDIELKDFTKALTRIRGTITESMLDELKKWNSQFGALSI